jgi:hypothetical protein
VVKAIKFAINFEENEIEDIESFIPSAAFVDKEDVNYYYFFISIWDQFNNHYILII